MRYLGLTAIKVLALYLSLIQFSRYLCLLNFPPFCSDCRHSLHPIAAEEGKVKNGIKGINYYISEFKRTGI